MTEKDTSARRIDIQCCICDDEVESDEARLMGMLIHHASLHKAIEVPFVVTVMIA